MIGKYILGWLPLMVIGIWKIQSSGQAVAIGFIWLGMTVVFEFVFGHYVVGHSISRHRYRYGRGGVEGLER